MLNNLSTWHFDQQMSSDISKKNVKLSSGISKKNVKLSSDIPKKEC